MSMSMGNEHFQGRLNGYYQCIMVQLASPGRLNAKVLIRLKFLTGRIRLICVPYAPVEGPVL